MSNNGLLPFSAKIGNEGQGTIRYVLVYAFEQADEGNTALQITPSLPQDTAQTARALHQINLPLSSVFEKARSRWARDHAFIDLSDESIKKEKENNLKQTL